MEAYIFPARSHSNSYIFHKVANSSRTPARARLFCIFISFSFRSPSSIMYSHYSNKLFPARRTTYLTIAWIINTLILERHNAGEKMCIKSTKTLEWIGAFDLVKHSCLIFNLIFIRTQCYRLHESSFFAHQGS